MSRIKPIGVFVAVVAFTAVVSSCGGSGTSSAKSHPRAVSATTPSTTAVPPPAQQFPTYTATALQPQVDVHDSPGGPTTQTLNNPLPEGTTLTLLLTPDSTPPAGSWVHVFLPVKPNGSTGWVPVSEVKIEGNPYRIVVNQSQHQLSLYNYTTLQHTYPVAVGAPATPTPVGTFFITQLLKTTNPGIYGDYAYGLSGHSPTLESFDGYDAEIGLHGTGDPSSIGHSVSHGCVRLNNGDIDSLVPVLPLGTSVEIQS